MNTSYLSAAWLDHGTIVYPGRGGDLRRSPPMAAPSRPVADLRKVQRINFTVLFGPCPEAAGSSTPGCPGNCAVESAIYVFDFAADSSRLVVPNAAGAWCSPTGHLLYTDRAGGLYAAGFDPKRLALTSGAVRVIEGVAPASFTMSASGTVLYSLVAGGSAPSELVWVPRRRDGATRFHLARGLPVPRVVAGRQDAGRQRSRRVHPDLDPAIPRHPAKAHR